ncbi:metalloregulator ArsR/SmtB family transcription factor [Thermococcus nautili]|uniref:Putative transcriptional regulators n=1 Tax=Thermococcus nautili TaxID=195522 RepID=W8NS75_9EURY|nr:metalloregulator ArsR/SmtB family transcription factor [Thermococcus nautili]AHL22093.1 putative transcriptional regulators [Thermococcus nautili]NJE48669.1 ArsR family transcriptional regulator [Thermococcus sp. 9N3]
MKVRELFERLDERQKKTVMRCVERCGIPELEAEIEPKVNEDAVKFLKVLSNPLRLAILKLLRDQWLCVCLISEALQQDQTLISHHLRTLKSLGLVEERKEGRMRFYRAKRDVIEEYLAKVRGELLGE